MVARQAQRRTHDRPRASRGLTLLELMVTLMIVSMGVGLLGQLMHQMSQVERRLEEEGGSASVHWASRLALRGMVESALPEFVSRPNFFTGDARQVRLASAEALELPGSAQGRLQLRFEGSSLPGGEQRLVLDMEGAGGLEAPAPRPTVLLSWRGEPGRIDYLDEQGRWQAQWPYDLEVLRRPPRVMRLHLPASQGGDLWLSIATTQGPRPSLADWMLQ